MAHSYKGGKERRVGASSKLARSTEGDHFKKQQIKDKKKLKTWANIK